ncbi:MAG: hypothetical protein ACXU7H_07400 [Burkholderiaceae bacterium]
MLATWRIAALIRRNESMLRNLLPYLGITNGNPGDNAKAAWSQLILGLMAFVGIGTLFSAIAIINIIWLFTQPNWFALLLLSISIAFVVSSLRNLRNDLTTFRKNVDRPDVRPKIFMKSLRGTMPVLVLHVETAQKNPCFGSRSHALRITLKKLTIFTATVFTAIDLLVGKMEKSNFPQRQRAIRILPCS